MLKELLLKIKPSINGAILTLIEDSVNAYYQDYYRHFHTLEEHIIPGLILLEKYKHLCERIDLIAIAWWYHDVICIPGDLYNEKLSASKAYYDCKTLNIDTEQCSIIRGLIQATEHFKMEPEKNDELIIHDLDLAILGSSPERYNKYEKLIFKEYEPLVDEATFIRGRKYVLKAFLDENYIYMTKEFRRDFEEQARINISNQLKKI